jgi:hypothetical protein
MNNFEPCNQDEFSKANSDVEFTIQKLLIQKLKDKKLNFYDYRILSRAYSSFSSYLLVESENKVLENRI